MSPTEFQGATAIFIVTLAILVHHYACSVERFQAELGDRDASLSAHAHRFMGFAVLGLVPWLFCFPLAIENPGLGMEQPAMSALVTISLAAVAAMVVWSTPANEVLLSHYPMVRTEQWTPTTHVMSVISWGVFLLGYEFMYRGFLLFVLMDSVGAVYALAISTSLYVLHHLPKAGDEAFGSILFGLVLGGLAIWSGGFWPAFVLHTVVAVVGEYNFLRAHPVIRG